MNNHDLQLCHTCPKKHPTPSNPLLNFDAKDRSATFPLIAHTSIKKTQVPNHGDLEYNPHANLISTSFCRYLKRKKVSSRF